MRHEPTSSQTPAGALLQQHAAISVEEIDHGIQTFKRLIDRLEGHQERNRIFHDRSDVSFGGKRLHLMGGWTHQGDYTSDIDPLTDLYARRLLNRYFAHEVDRSSGMATP